MVAAQVSNMRTTLACLTLAITALGAGCTSASKDQTDLETNRALFTQPPLPSYAFTWELSCFCGPDPVRPIRITVVRGDITSAAYVDDQQPVSESIRTGLKTIDGVFDLIQQRLDEHADEVTVAYDPDRHYPTSVFIDITKQAADEEISLKLSDLVSPTGS
jgi:hypothetical protein